MDRIPRDQYLVRIRDTGTSSRCSNLSKVWSLFQRVRMKRAYVIQQGIESVNLEGRPFDVRAHAMRVGGKWQVIGLVGRIAPAKSIVTNRHSGGKPRYIEDLLTRDLGYSPRTKKKAIHTMYRLALYSSRTISRAYPRWYEFGVDLGIDPQHNVWIYEVNIGPGITSFRQVDQPTYQRILSLRKKAK